MPNKNKMQLIQIRDLAKQLGITFTDKKTKLLYDYEGFPEKPELNSINDLVLYVNENPDVIDHYYESLNPNKQWLFISEYFKRHSCFASSCVHKALENIEQLNEFYLRGEPDFPDTKISSVTPWSETGLVAGVQPAVVGEVLLLFANLHYDCVRTYEKMKREREKSVVILNQSTEFEERKLKIIANAVQKEHDIFLAENTELLHKYELLQRKYMHAMKNYALMKEKQVAIKMELDKADNEMPFLEEKIAEEQVLADDLKNNLDKCQKHLDMVEEQYAKVTENHALAKSLMEKEKGQLNMKIKGMQDEICQLKTSVTESRSLNEVMVKDIKSLKKQMAETLASKKKLEVKFDNYVEANDFYVAEYKEVTHKLNETIRTNNILKKNSIKMKKDLYMKKFTHQKELKALSKEKIEIEELLSEQIEANEKLMKKSNTLLHRINTVYERRTSKDREIARISHQIMRLQSQLLSSRDEMEAMTELNAMYQQTISKQPTQTAQGAHRENKLMYMIQQMWRNKEDATAKVNSMTQEITEKRYWITILEEARDEQKATLTKYEEETIKILSVLQKKLSIIDELKSQRRKKLESLLLKKRELEAKFAQKIKDEEDYLKKLLPLRQMLLEELEFLEMKIREMIEAELAMKAQMKEMESKRVLHSHMTQKIKNSIRRNRTGLMYINSQIGNADIMNTRALDALQDSKERTTFWQTKHKALIEERNEALQQVLKWKEKLLAENAEIAGKYRTAQQNLLQLRLDSVESNDQNIELQFNTHDLRQLLAMQLTVHQNLNHHLTYRGTYYTWKCSYLERETDNNHMKVSVVKTTIDDSIEKMAERINEEIAESIERSVRLKEQQRNQPQRYFYHAPTKEGNEKGKGKTKRSQRVQIKEEQGETEEKLTRLNTRERERERKTERESEREKSKGGEDNVKLHK